ncbi:glycosyltransferase [Pedococcus bigeumensis]|uniref:Glycosyltransferase family 1 protein n=1 Tax=Pedococcus bigeumensis TaxID=433644 RepID=A0A502CNM3_9MICO|nr:glycosyltransferase [Pedococcus bigeumensis]TPG13291.1 glycosyltransferase family 1 protein [Pedococcus bigeumensis]
MSIVVASIPSGHVYVRHLSPSAGSGGDTVVRLPDPPSGASPDSPWWPPRMLTTDWIAEHAADFDLMHIHFGFDALSPDHLRDVAAALRRHAKPLVLTVHDLRNPHHDAAATHDSQLDVLMASADAIVTLTPGAASVIRTRWGRDAIVLPHPHVVPDEWLGRPRPERDGFVVGLHAKSLRANMDPLPLVDALTAALPDMPGARLRVDAHTDVMTAGFPRHDIEFADHLNDLANHHLIELRVHDFFSDDELWNYLHDLDVSVLPYQFGTHSGWLEACHDLGTWVAAPDCGFYAEQRPCLTYAATGPERASSLVEAVRTAHTRWLAGEVAPRADLADRHTERTSLARSHTELYAEVLERRLACTS